MMRLLETRRLLRRTVLTRAMQSAAVEARPDVLPVRHSRKKLPSVCLDPQQISEMTAQILEAPDGSLFSYESGADNSHSAWSRADHTVQQVEFLMRGYAHSIPGTQWNRWLRAFRPRLQDPELSIMQIQALMDRMWKEGTTYMTLRAARLEELYGPKNEDEDDDRPFDEDGSIEIDLEDLDGYLPDGESEEEDYLEHDTDDEDGVFEDILRSGSTTKNQGNEEESPKGYFNDFALPGPTVHMHDIMLDCLACHPSYPGPSNEGAPAIAFAALEDILSRNNLDGGDGRNTNPHTMPTAMSFNAPIRLAASLEFDIQSKKKENLELRDSALILAFGAFDAMTHSAVDRNCATYAYLLDCIGKYVPTSKTKGNIAHGLFRHATTQGLIDKTVMDAFVRANTPSNGDEFDKWISSLELSVPMKWKRHVNVRRYHPREATY